jgi:type VI secretion system secreted protein Hcp
MFDAFLRVDGIQGESTDDKHQGWIELLSYSHEAKQPASSTASSSGGASSERVTFGAVSVSKLVDKASPKLLEACCTGRHIKEVIIEVCRAGGNNKEKYLEIRMEKVLISGYTHQGSGQFPIEGISFHPGVFKMTYTQQKRADGTPGGNVAMGWDLTQNKTTA